MRYLTLLVVLLLAAIGPSSIPVRAATAGCSLTYTVRLVPGGRGQVSVLLEAVQSPEITFSMVDPITQTIDCSQGVLDVEAVGPGDTRLPLSRVPDGWCVSTQGHKSLTFRYSFSPDLQGRRGAWIRRVTTTGAFFVNGAVLAFPNVPVASARVVFDAPPGWVVGTSFVPDGDNAFRVEGIPDLPTDLLNNVTRAGEARTQVTKKSGDVEITFIDYGGWHTRAEIEEYVDLTAGSIEFFRALMGTWPGGSRYWISPFPVDENEAHTYHHNRWLQVWPRAQHPQVPHHVLHAWIWWDEHSPIRPMVPEWMWIQEGLPTYYEAVLTTRLTGDDAWLGINYTSYLIMKRAAKFGLLDKETVATYAVSHMRVLALDHAIRQQSGGRKGVDDLLALLGKRFGQHRQSFYRDQLMAAINETAGGDLSGFYLRYVAGETGNELPPVDEIINQYGEPFLRWLDICWPGRRTLALVGLELRLHKSAFLESEHIMATGGRLPALDLSLFSAMLRRGATLTEKDVTTALSSLTGVDQSDFFEFYTVGGYRPSLKEIAEFVNPSLYPDPQVSPPPASPSMAAYLSPARIEVAKPVPVDIVIHDERLVSERGTVRVTVQASSDRLLSSMLRGTTGHRQSRSVLLPGVVWCVESGDVGVSRTGEREWRGTVTLTAPVEVAGIFVNAAEDSDYRVGLRLELATATGELVGGSIRVMIGGREYSFDPPPVVIGGRTLVPMRALFEALGATVVWDVTTSTAVGVRGGVEVRIPLGSTSPTVSGIIKRIDVPALLIEGRTFIPLRFVSESLGDEVKWDETTRTITVTTR